MSNFNAFLLGIVFYALVGLLIRNSKRQSRSLTGLEFIVILLMMTLPVLNILSSGLQQAWENNQDNINAFFITLGKFAIMFVVLYVFAGDKSNNK